MPSKIKVKINSVEETVRGNFNGREIKGYNATDRKPYKNFVFETTKDGSETKQHAVARTLNQDEWVELTVDDTKYKNIQYINKISAPANADVPASSSGRGGSSSVGSDKMSKAEWAAKDAAKELSIHRQSALKQAVAASIDGTKLNASKVNAIEKLSLRFVNFLQNGDFDMVEAPKVEPKVETKVNDTRDEMPETTVTPDDDIPF